MKRLIDFLQDKEKLIGFIRDNKDMIIKVTAAAVAVVVAFFIFAPGKENSDNPSEMPEENPMVTEESTAKVYVDIGGEVQNPMVAELEEGSRVEDAIAAAGGLTEKADVTQINRAAFIEDGEKIFIPSVGDDESLMADEKEEVRNSEGYSPSDGKVNINTADSRQLQQLDGVGPVTAEKIIAYREENGRFDSIEDIKNVSGIGDKTFDKFKDMIKLW